MKQEDKKIKMEDFVSFEIAKKLKEKGFREKCIATYDIEDGEFDFNNYILTVAYRMNLSVKDCLRLFNNTTNTGLIDAPTISQVLKWLREEKLILIALSPTQEYDCNGFIGWCSTVYKADKQGGMSWQEELYYQSYEEAALAGIEYVLDNLI